MPAEDHFDVWVRAFPEWDTYRHAQGWVKVA